MYATCLCVRACVCMVCVYQVTVSVLTFCKAASLLRATYTTTKRREKKSELYVYNEITNGCQMLKQAFVFVVFFLSFAKQIH